MIPSTGCNLRERRVRAPLPACPTDIWRDWLIARKLRFAGLERSPIGEESCFAGARVIDDVDLVRSGRVAVVLRSCCASQTPRVDAACIVPGIALRARSASSKTFSCSIIKMVISRVGTSLSEQGHRAGESGGSACAGPTLTKAANPNP